MQRHSRFRAQTFTETPAGDYLRRLSTTAGVALRPLSDAPPVALARAVDG